MKRSAPKRVAVVGTGPGVAQCALTLARMGVEAVVVTPSRTLGPGNGDSGPDASSPEYLRMWPMLLQAATNPLVRLYTGSQVTGIRGAPGDFVLSTSRQPRYVHEDRCTGCGRCEEACSVKVPEMVNGRRIVHGAIHKPSMAGKATPSAYTIDKSGVAPCRAACPLGINVQGMACLISAGKADKALNLISEAAPLAGVLGRVCTHPCEDACNRSRVDSPVFVQSLHRYASDSVHGSIAYSYKAPAGSKKEKVAIVGSGPSGLGAAWELARRGYNVTIFESHAVIGGMLATGIPRFRLPREVREREVEAIRALGVDIKTGITVGRDVTIADLRKRGYGAFLLAIGAQQNNRLNIPGEDLDGVVDCVSLLFTLNLKVGASVGSKVVVIGGGNSAVDSARATKRMSKGSVRVIYRRTAGEMTAVKEDIEEAIKEGIIIDYLTSPVEILGDGVRVKGIRCQRMSLGEPGPDGRRSVTPVPGSEFVIEADHVVVAIGQRPNLTQLNIKGLQVGQGEDLVQVDPVTLETSLPGVFAGGDCVRGPNNVVEAVSDGLRAADSIDRFLSNEDLKEGRAPGRPPAPDVNIAEREVLPYKRAQMPAMPLAKRKGNFEETNTGLPEEMAEREAARCISCALCSECKECVQVCEPEAIFHEDTPRSLDLEAAAVIDFRPAEQSLKGVISAASPEEGEDLFRQLARASAAALEASAQLKSREEPSGAPISGYVPVAQLGGSSQLPAGNGERRIGVVVCQCGGGTSSVVDFNEMVRDVQHLPDVCSVQEVSQCCSQEGAGEIAEHVSSAGLDRVVVAACRCCNLEQVCFSCTDRRILCQQYLSDGALPKGTAVEYVNIREQCAWAHRDDLAGATRKATEIIAAGVARLRRATAPASDQHTIAGSVLVLGSGLAGLSLANQVAGHDYAAVVISSPDNGAGKPRDYLVRQAGLVRDLEKQGIKPRPWPTRLDVRGSPGSYKVHLDEGGPVEVGAIVLDLDSLLKGHGSAGFGSIPAGSLLGRILSRRSYFEGLAGSYSTTLRALTIKETAGLFIISENSSTPEDLVMKGAATAGRVLAYLKQGAIGPRSNAVTIDSSLCRGCGDCAAICPYIELRAGDNGTAAAFIDRTLCLGCGGCIASCPTGAITQVGHDDGQIGATLEALLGKSPAESPTEAAGVERTWI